MIRNKGAFIGSLLKKKKARKKFGAVGSMLRNVFRPTAGVKPFKESGLATFKPTKQYTLGGVGSGINDYGDVGG